MTATIDTLRLLDFATEMVSLHDGEGRFVTSSAVSQDVLGFPASDLVGKRISDLVHPEDAAALEHAFDGVPGERRIDPVTATCRLRHADGYWAWTEVTVRPAVNSYDGSTIVAIRDAAELVAARQASEWAQETLRQVFEHAPTPMAMLGLDNRFEQVNAAFCALLETTADQLVGRSVGGFVNGGDSPAERFALSELASGRTLQLVGDLTFVRGGREHVVATTRRAMAHAANGRQHVVLHVLSVEQTAGVRVPEQARHEAGRLDREPRLATDSPTSLTSRPLLLDRLMVAASRPERDSHYLVLFFVDVDGTAKILDRHSRRTLDSVLTKTGNRLRATVRADDTVARFGDRGFVVLCPTVGASSDVVVIRQRLTRAVSDAAIVCDGRKFKVSARVGASIVGPREDWTPESLVVRADEAMGTHA